MARIRTIKPGFFRSLTVADLPIPTRLTWIGLWTYVDDAGRGVDDARLIKAELWPLDDSYTAKKVEHDMALLEANGSIRRYVVDGRRYFHICEWHHQRIDKPTPSVLPEPSGNPPGTVEEASVQEGNRNRNRKGIGIGGEDSPPGGGSKRATAAPESLPLDDELRAWAAEHIQTVYTEQQLERETDKFLDHHRAKGSTMKDWRAAWRTWMLRADEYSFSPLAPHGARRVSASDDAITRVFAQLPRGAA